MPIFTAESARQAELIENLAEKYGKRVRLILRLSSGNQFGLSENDIISHFNACPKSAAREAK